MRDDALEPAKLDDPGLKVRCHSAPALRPVLFCLAFFAGSVCLATSTCRTLAGGGCGGRHGLLHAGSGQDGARAQRDAHRPVAAPAGEGAEEGRPAGRHHCRGAQRGPLPVFPFLRMHLCCFSGPPMLMQCACGRSLTPAYETSATWVQEHYDQRRPTGCGGAGGCRGAALPHRLVRSVCVGGQHRVLARAAAWHPGGARAPAHPRRLACLVALEHTKG